MFPSDRNQSGDLQSKSTDWCLYDGNMVVKGLKRILELFFFKTIWRFEERQFCLLKTNGHADLKLSIVVVTTELIYDEEYVFNNDKNGVKCTILEDSSIL